MSSKVYVSNKFWETESRKQQINISQYFKQAFCRQLLTIWYLSLFILSSNKLVLISIDLPLYKRVQSLLGHPFFGSYCFNTNTRLPGKGWMNHSPRKLSFSASPKSVSIFLPLPSTSPQCLLSVYLFEILLQNNSEHNLRKLGNK